MEQIRCYFCLVETWVWKPVCPWITWQTSSENRYLVSLLCSQPLTHSACLFPAHFWYSQGSNPFPSSYLDPSDLTLDSALLVCPLISTYFNYNFCLLLWLGDSQLLWGLGYLPCPNIISAITCTVTNIAWNTNINTAWNNNNNSNSYQLSTYDESDTEFSMFYLIEILNLRLALWKRYYFNPYHIVKLQRI